MSRTVRHWLYRCAVIEGNTKLAQRPIPTPENPHLRQALIETRGEGGWIVTAPSHGPVHASGRPYELLSGGFDRIATITTAERDALFRLARTFDEIPPPTVPIPQGPRQASAEGRPGDDFNARATWAEVLEPYGWTALYRRGDTIAWKRPDKKEPGLSATTGYAGSDLLYVFSSSTPFEPERGYNKFSAYTLLNHGGDSVAAARELAARGFGAPARAPLSSPSATSGQSTLPRFRTASEIARSEPEIPEWVVELTAARKAITELSAKIKVGKTTFIAFMLSCVLTGSPFLGRRTNPVPVVWLTEERDSTFRSVLSRAGLLDRDDLYVLTYGDVRGMALADVVAAAVQFAKEHSAGLLIIDTLSAFAGIHGDGENAAGEALAAMQEVALAAEAGMAVIVVRHDRKSGGEIGDSARGSSAWGGAADILLSLRRVDGQGHDNRRSLQGVGRFDGIPANLIIEMQGGTYVAIGDAEAVEAEAVRATVLDFLPDNAENAKVEADILEHLGERGSRSTMRRVLDELLKAGTVQREKGHGQNGRAYGYYRNQVTVLERDDGQLIETPRREPAPPALNHVTNHQSLDGHLITAAAESDELTNPHTDGQLIESPAMDAASTAVAEEEVTEWTV